MDFYDLWKLWQPLVFGSWRPKKTGSALFRLAGEKQEVDAIREFDLFRTTTTAAPTTTQKYYPAHQQVWGVGSVVAGTLNKNFWTETYYFKMANRINI